MKNIFYAYTFVLKNKVLILSFSIVSIVCNCCISDAIHYIKHSVTIVRTLNAGAMTLNAQLFSLQDNHEVLDNFLKDDTIIFVLLKETIMDIDGNEYHTVKIGNQIWMLENLKVTHYRNGDPIPNVNDYKKWGGLTTGAYCNYQNDGTFSVDFGRLYNYFAVCNKRQIAPEGWHVPTAMEWDSLLIFIGGGSGTNKKLINLDDKYWKFNMEDTLYYKNESGFTAIPGGCRKKDGWFFNLSEIANYWTATGVGNNISAHMYVISRFGNEHRIENNINGYSVRCIKD